MSQQAREDKCCTTCAFVWSGGAFWTPNPTPTQPPCPKRSRGASRSKDVVKLGEDELHCLVLVNHIHRHVAVVPLRAHQGRPKHNANVLCGHPVGVRVLQHTAGSDREKDVQFKMTSVISAKIKIRQMLLREGFWIWARKLWGWQCQSGHHFDPDRNMSETLG